MCVQHIALMCLKLCKYFIDISNFNGKINVIKCLNREEKKMKINLSKESADLRQAVSDLRFYNILIRLAVVSILILPKLTISPYLKTTTTKKQVKYIWLNLIWISVWNFKATKCHLNYCENNFYVIPSHFPSYLHFPMYYFRRCMTFGVLLYCITISL